MRILAHERVAYGASPRGIRYHRNRTAVAGRRGLWNYSLDELGRHLLGSCGFVNALITLRRHHRHRVFWHERDLAWVQPAVPAAEPRHARAAYAVLSRCLAHDLDRLREPPWPAIDCQYPASPSCVGLISHASPQVHRRRTTPNNRRRQRLGHTSAIQALSGLVPRLALAAGRASSSTRQTEHRLA